MPISRKGEQAPGELIADARASQTRSPTHTQINMLNDKIFDDQGFHYARTTSYGPETILVHGFFLLEEGLGYGLVVSRSVPRLLVRALVPHNENLNSPKPICHNKIVGFVFIT